MNFVKHIRTKQIKEDTSFNLEGVLSYNFTMVGDTPARLGSKRLAYQEDILCVESDGIPFGKGNTIEIFFDDLVTTQQIDVEYIQIECCENP